MTPATGRMLRPYRFDRWVTGRHGLSVETGPSGSPSGVSLPPFDSFNLGGGVGDDPKAVRANRSALRRQLGLAPGRLVFMEQVHGVAIAEVTAPTLSPFQATDGMVTATTGLGLAVLVADCVPVVAADPVAGVVGVAHAGRLGAAGGIVPALIERMTGLGASASHLEVLVGPAICGRCYEVPAPMRDEIDARLPGSACVTSAGTAGLDLRAGIARQLRELGVGTLELDGRCTREDPNLFSHRRSGLTGRFAAIVRLTRPAG